MGEPDVAAGRPARLYPDARAVLASMHGKERVIAPLLQPLGLHVLPAGIDTDAFGTFSRERPRLDTPLATARAKIDAALTRHPECRVALASEGSFGAHPASPLLPWAHELVLFVDRDRELSVIGEDRGAATNYAHAPCISTADARAFAARVGFPAHGLIAMACVDGRPAPALALHKDLHDEAVLLDVVARLVDRHGLAWLETDMRAHRNPTRMAAIARATADLVRRLSTPCPRCGQPGYGQRETRAGRPCADCGAPTRLPRVAIFACAGCGAAEERPLPDAAADPAHCDFCNP